GHLHLDLGQTEQARQRFREALVLYQQAPDSQNRRDGEAAAWNAMGKAFLEEKNPGSALQPLQKALALRRPGSLGQAVTRTSLGVAYRQLNRPEEARKAYAEALPIFVGLGNSSEQAVCLLNLGWLEAAAHRDDPAFDDFDRASVLFAKLEDPPDLAQALRGKAEVLRHRGLLEDARQAMEAALTAIERHRFRQESRTTRASFFATQQSSYDFLIDLLMEMHREKPDAGYDALALGVGERALARSLLDALDARGTDLRGAPPQLLARERGLDAAIEDLGARQSRLAEKNDEAARRELRAVDAELAQKREDLEGVRAELRAASPRYAALTQPQPWSAAEVQRQLLDRDTLLLEYRLGTKGSFLWALTPDSLQSFGLPGRAELAEKVSRASGLLAGSRARKTEISADQQLAKLSAILLGPVASLLPGKRLLVVGDGALQSLPFAALPEPGGGEPLVARHEIVSLPSISVLGALRREVAGRRPAARALWVLGDPDFGGAFPTLPYTREEAKAILALAPARDSTAILGRVASRGAVLSGLLNDYSFLHFATHGSFAASDPGGGQLVLSQVDANGRRVANGFLHLADIYGLDLRADLVVLSACQSALGKDVRGEGLVGMTRGFFYAGAERVLVSLWNVNDRVTVDLMRSFYHGIFAERLSPAAALRAAQDAIRRQERWRSPYYWAGFTLQGEWR
ncbi:MAG: hypothetical protein QOJ16_624, partial [Acidobacteriota bacterium]|nr:hypothetical protein [Acidobacteriota bacterium]